jgi:hypothetical protein
MGQNDADKDFDLLILLIILPTSFCQFFSTK